MKKFKYFILLISMTFCSPKNKINNWFTYTQNNDKVEELYLNSSTLISKNIYKKNGNINFYILDTLIKQSLSGETKKYDFIKHSSYYYKNDLYSNDSIKLRFWQPTEKNYIYSYKIFYMNKLVWKKKSIDEPCFDFKQRLIKIDSFNSSFYFLEKKIFRDRKLLFSINDTFFILKNNKIIFYDNCFRD